MPQKFNNTTGWIYEEVKHSVVLLVPKLRAPVDLKEMPKQFIDLSDEILSTKNLFLLHFCGFEFVRFNQTGEQTTPQWSTPKRLTVFHSIR